MGGGGDNQKKRRQIKKLIARLTREVKEHLQDENTSVINKFVWKLKMLLWTSLYLSKFLGKTGVLHLTEVRVRVVAYIEQQSVQQWDAISVLK